MKKYFVLGAIIVPQFSFAMIDRNNSNKFLKDDNGNILQYCKTYYLDAKDAVKIRDKIGNKIGLKTQMIAPNNDGLQNITFYLETKKYYYEAAKYPIAFFPEMNIHSTYCENEKLSSFKTNLISTAEFIKKDHYLYFQFNNLPTFVTEDQTSYSSDNLMNRSEKSWKQIDTMREESHKRLNTMREESKKSFDELKKRDPFQNWFN